MWSIRNERLTTKKRGEGFFFFPPPLHVTLPLSRRPLGVASIGFAPLSISRKNPFGIFFFTLLEREGQRRSIVTAKMCQLLHKVRKYESDRQGLTMWRESLMGINRVAIFNFFFRPRARGRFWVGNFQFCYIFPLIQRLRVTLNEWKLVEHQKKKKTKIRLLKGR